jgi:hypothetical protein
MATIDQSTFEAVNNGNFKAIADLATAEALGHQSRLNGIKEAGMAKAIEAIHGTNVEEGLGLAAAQRGDLAKIVAELGNVSASLGQMMKGLALTPPPTGGA